MTFVSYAQNFEDVLLWRALRDVGEGYYIDVGAAHPDIDSVTRAFYERGWHGINIEPVAELHTRLVAARPRDISLRNVLGETAAPTTLFVVPGTGLSTIEEGLAEQHAASGFSVRQEGVRGTTLAAICSEHAAETIHFLKIDAEGAERAVLLGADFTRHRPWLILVESTAPNSTIQVHESWEPLLVEANYVFVWFDGLNRFYISKERHGQLAHHFTTPVCVFDDFLRAADTEWTRRIVQAEQQAAELLERSMAAEATIAVAESRARSAEQGGSDAERRSHDLETRLRDTEARAQAAERRSADAESRARDSEGRAQAAERRSEAAESRTHEMEVRVAAAERRQEDATDLLAKVVEVNKRQQADLKQLSEDLALARAVETNSAGNALWQRLVSFRFRGAPVATQPIRQASDFHQGAPVPLAIPTPRSHPVPPPSPVSADTASPYSTSNNNDIGLKAHHVGLGTRAVHQFHSGSAVGDAITNSLLLIQQRLRALGYQSDIYVEHLDPALKDKLLPLDELPVTDSYVLIFHHSMGFDAFDRVVALPAAKILIYHNITPPEFLEGLPDIQRYSRLGRQQLAGLRDYVVASLGDSDYNVLELRRFGFEDPRKCTLLFDLDQLHTTGELQKAKTAGHEEPFTILFVGRIAPSKSQLELLKTFVEFRKLYSHPSRLVLVGRSDGSSSEYARQLHEQIQHYGIEAFVEITGLVSDEKLTAWYESADLYVSLSEHEGFGVPLVEAMAAKLPVLAWPAGAVVFTLAAIGLLDSREPSEVARTIYEFARDPKKRRHLADEQQVAIARFSLPLQMNILLLALARAGAAFPRDTSLAATIKEELRFTVAGHAQGSYSLASVNRTLAEALEQKRPGRVRFEPVEGVPLKLCDETLPRELETIRKLTAREAHVTGPVVVISQHYPVHVPINRGDVLLAYVFWEESMLPAETIRLLNGKFDGILAPSRFVAKALRDSGAAIPIYVVGYAPPLKALQGLEQLGCGYNEFLPTRPVSFLHVSSGFPRKGLDVLLEAYSRAFRASDSVNLVIKTFPNPRNQAAEQIRRFREADTGAAAIEHIDTDIGEPAMLKLYADADVMVLPTRGEGFNIPAAEALSAGLPLIVTGYGGHMDFCNAGNSRLLGFRLAPSQSHLASPTSLWAEPDAADLVAAFRQAYEHLSARKAVAREARDGVMHYLSSDVFVQKVEGAAVTALLKPRKVILRLCVVSSWNVRCGVADYAGYLLKALVETQPDMRVVVLADMRSADADGSHSFSQSSRFSVRRSWKIGSDHIAYDLQRAIALENPDVVLFQHQPALISWPEFARSLEMICRSGRVTIATLHNTASILSLSASERTFVLIALRKVARIIVHSLRDITRLSDLGLSENVVLIPQGAPDALCPPDERALIMRDIVTVGCCGFLLPGKGLPALTTAVSMLKTKWPKLRLRLMTASYGSEESHSEELLVRSLAREQGLGQDLELVTDFLPYSESLYRLSACDVVVLPYPDSQEGSSAALRMALASGRCVAVTPIGLFDEAVGAAHTFSGVEPAALARDIDALLIDQESRRFFRQRGREWLSVRRWEIIGTRIMGMMQGLVDDEDTASSSTKP